MNAHFRKSCVYQSAVGQIGEPLPMPTHRRATGIAEKLTIGQGGRDVRRRPDGYLHVLTDEDEVRFCAFFRQATKAFRQGSPTSLPCGPTSLTEKGQEMIDSYVATSNSGPDAQRGNDN